MNANITILLFVFLLPVDGCNKSAYSKCSGSARCTHHIYKRTASTGSTSENQNKEPLNNAQRVKDPCSFDTYDSDGDGIINLKELFDILGFDKATETMFKDLNAMKGDGAISPEEFHAKITEIVSECKQTET